MNILLRDGRGIHILPSDVERPCARDSENERSKPSGGVPALCLYLRSGVARRIACCGAPHMGALSTHRRHSEYSKGAL